MPGHLSAARRGSFYCCLLSLCAALILLPALVCTRPCRAADPETEIAKFLGKNLAQSLGSESGVIEDPLLLQWVQRVGARLTAVAPRHDLPYHFMILDTEEANAFTLPGGYIFVTRGLLDYLRSQDELAGVMGHEIGHVTGHHPIRLIEWQLGSSLAVRYAPLPHGRVASVLEQGAVLLSTLGISRHNEAQADQYGIRFATEAGYDPDGLKQFLESFGNAKEKPNLLARYLATHPSDSTRIRALNRTPYLDPKNWQFQTLVGDRLSANCRPALAVAHYHLALAAHPGDMAIQQKLDQEVKACGHRVLPPEPPAGSSVSTPASIPAPTSTPESMPTTAAPETPHTPGPPAAGTGTPPAPGPASPSTKAPLPAPSKSGTPVGPITLLPAPPAEPTAAPLTREAALLDLRGAEEDAAAKVRGTTRSLQRMRRIQNLNVTLRDGLLGAATTRLDDIRWLVLAYQAYADVNRISDVYARVAQVNRNLQNAVIQMEIEMNSAPPARRTAAWTAAAEVAAESHAAGRDMADAVAHLERAVYLTATVLGDLDTVLLGFGGRVHNLRFATVEAVLLAANSEINSGRHLSTRALGTFALVEDRVLLVEMNRIGDGSDEQRLATFDCNIADLLGIDARQVQSIRATGEGYGDTVLALALATELNQPAAQVQSRYHRFQVFTSSQAVPGPTVSWVDGVIDQGGSPALVEIMLRQAAQDMREESDCA